MADSARLPSSQGFHQLQITSKQLFIIADNSIKCNY